MAGIESRGFTRYLVAGILVALGLMFAGAGGAQANGAHTSIVGGGKTSIKKWPWQVAFLQSKAKRPKAKPSKRFICGGSLIAPTIVVTATHCAIDIDLSKPEYFSVIAGRTNLNKVSQGTEVVVKDAYFPTTRSGVPRYVFSMFDARWDIAVLELTEPVDQPTIKLAGPTETDLIRPGRVAYKTGWGVHDSEGEGDLSLILRKSKTAIQPARACAESIGGELGYFDTDSQICIGDPDSDSIPCYGDSGGPAVVPSSDGYRLFGATSFGEGYGCYPEDLSVDAAIARTDTRDWIAGIVMEKTGIDVVGSGATTGEMPIYCEVPRIERVKLPRARAQLRQAGCGVGKIHRVVIGHGKRYRKLDGTVLDLRDGPFMLKERGHKVDMVVAKWTPTHRRGE